MVRPRLPPLNAIKAFEAAARLRSFTRAAEELNVTHGAISRQIRLLEDWLGTRLFYRTSRNAVPTQLVCRSRPCARSLGDNLSAFANPRAGSRRAPRIGFADFRD